MSNELIGSRIIIISKQELRYEGLLRDLNPQDDTFLLADVIMYGSEGRNAALGKAEVQAAPVRFPLIQFNARDIKDLKVVKVETPATIDDPAVVILEAPEALPTAKAPEASSNAAPSLFEAASAESKKHYNSSSHSRPANRGPPRPRPTGPVGDLTTEFDIEASNAKLSTLSLDGDSAPAAKAYDKTASFFDTMSSDMKDRAERSKNPMTGREMRAAEGAQNMDTFGHDPNYVPSYRGRGRGGRGRGGRGGQNRNYQQRDNGDYHQPHYRNNDERRYNQGHNRGGNHYNNNQPRQPRPSHDNANSDASTA